MEYNSEITIIVKLYFVKGPKYSKKHEKQAVLQKIEKIKYLFKITGFEV